MKKILSAALAALFLCASAVLPLPSSAATRVMVYAGQNPDTNETNIAWRFQRLQAGILQRDVLGGLAPGGAYSGLKLVPGSGLYVTVNPAPSSQLGAIYQYQADDTTALPPAPGAPPNQLQPDNTQIIVQALQSAPSAALGPLSAPSTTGKAIYYLIEAQLGSIDTANQSMLFISTSGVTSYQNVNTQRQDTITYQTNSNGGSAVADCNATFPPVPTPDSGWVGVGLVCVAHGISQVTNAMISPYSGANFNGYSFGTINFGGPYAQDGNINPSTLTTHGGQQGCGNIAVTAGGLAISNPTSPNGGGNLIGSDLNGDFFLCGQTLFIDDQQSNSGAARITINTSEDTGTNAWETLYPASGTDGNFHVGTGGAACSNASWCVSTNGEDDVCAKSTTASPGGAIITVANTHSNQVIAQTFVATGGRGVGVAFYNLSGTSITNSTLSFNYVCF